MVPARILLSRVAESQGVADLAAVLADLQAEGDDLDSIVSALSDDAWATATPAPGWTIAHQIGHLVWTDEIARLAVTDPAEFTAQLHRNLPVLETFVDTAAAERAQLPPQELLGRWREGRRALTEALLAAQPGAKLAWFGPPMSPTSMATARLMETWAHGQDVVDALGLARLPTPRLRHVAYLGWRTRDFAFLTHDLTPPAEPFRVSLDAPDGTVWTFGPDNAEQRVTGAALDFCLLVTQRRNRADLSLVAVGAEASTWLDIAQAFAGPPGPGRAPAS